MKTGPGKQISKPFLSVLFDVCALFYKPPGRAHALTPPSPLTVSLLSKKHEKG